MLFFNPPAPDHAESLRHGINEDSVPTLNALELAVDHFFCTFDKQPCIRTVIDRYADEYTCTRDRQSAGRSW